MEHRLNCISRMGKHRRLNIRGATYHAMARGNRKEPIFLDDLDREHFLEVVEEAAERYRVGVIVYCLMGNHFHLIVQTPDGNLSAFMRHVDGVYAQDFNWRYHLVGHVLQGPFRCVMIEGRCHLLSAVAYVVMNPVEAGLVAAPEAWPWSSYRAMAGLGEPPVYLSLDWIDRVFPASTRHESQTQFAEIISGGGRWKSFLDSGTPAVGPQAFRARIRAYIGETLFTADVPRSYKALFRPSLDELFAHVANKDERNQAIQRASVIHGYKLSEIARFLELHPNSVSRLLISLRRDSRRRGRR